MLFQKLKGQFKSKDKQLGISNLKKDVIYMLKIFQIHGKKILLKAFSNNMDQSKKLELEKEMEIIMLLYAFKNQMMQQTQKPIFTIKYLMGKICLLISMN